MSASEAERLARVALAMAFEPADPDLARDVAARGAVSVREDLLRTGSRDGNRKDAVARLAAVDPARDLERAQTNGLRFVVPGDDEWPTQLDDLEHAPEIVEGRGGVPLGLWVRGPVTLDSLDDSVAVVGSRSATDYGTSVTREMCGVLAKSRWAVVSGAAFGVDQAAHRGAVAAGGPTVAVLACGADRIYPAAHERLLEHLAEHGAVVSEAPPGASPMKLRFLARNRIIAALTRGTVVVEAAPRSGALNTAGWADGVSRQVMGVPGPVTALTSAGVHLLIRRGATLVSSGAEVLEAVGAAGDHLTVDVRGPERPRDHLSVRQLQVLDALPVGRPSGLDSIARIAGMEAAETARHLADLTRNGFAEKAGAGWRITAFART
ncbi:DNA-processing protein DprA [Nocardioides sp. CER19]|uniref:DNA-processing protein DprA n=1 Tax=Nocardioides sp. CER19 TaxID=3038538 RepID=UPI002447FCF0|nr:DNA-processing protein DprA [Nocardioides sp. CER19]MDH2416887.1 DNA-processing protein DprA [Nocardioides sp. CER19]